jgi:hypothetical protein
MTISPAPNAIMPVGDTWLHQRPAKGRVAIDHDGHRPRQNPTMNGAARPTRTTGRARAPGT